MNKIEMWFRKLMALRFTKNEKKELALIVAVGCLLIVLVGTFVGWVGSSAKAWGNRTWWDTTYSFERAKVDLLDGEVVEGAVEQWLDFEDSDMIQVKIDGKVYLTHSVNVVLISE